MAGIGFMLERMSLAVGAYVCAAFLVAGPWIFTILRITGIGLAACQSQCKTVLVFRSIVIYNSVFSFILANPIAYVCTVLFPRFFIKRYESITFAFVAELALFSIFAIAIAGSISS